jgi:hypothetical protein
MDPTAKKETLYISFWVIPLFLAMELVFLLLGRMDLSVLGGGLAGSVLAVGNYAIMSQAVVKAVSSGEPARASRYIQTSRTLRLLGLAALCALCVGVLKTNVYATLIPLIFPRIGIAFRPLMDRKRGKKSAETEGSDLLD